MDTERGINRNSGYTDIHTHILPGIDDGAWDMAEAVRIADIAYKEGIRTIIATPHYGRYNPGYDPEMTLKIFNETRSEIRAVHNDMELLTGNEIYSSPTSVQELKDGKALTLAGTDYVLVEFSTSEVYDRIYEGLRAFITEGYRPVLAHVERYESLFNKKKNIQTLIDSGVYIQVNSRNFLRSRFDKRAVWCRKLLKSGLIHFVASDCHDCESRKPEMKKAVDKMCEIAGEATVKGILETNIVKLINNRYL